jgi:hypothetical protein
VQGRHGARPGEELAAESVEMRLDLCRRQRRRRVLLYVHHVLAAHAEPDLRQDRWHRILNSRPCQCVDRLLQLGIISRDSVGVVVSSVSENNASA